MNAFAERRLLTLDGATRLRAELQQLKQGDRPAIIAAIAEARAHGDLKENAEYHAARERQSFVEGRIRTLEAALNNAEIINVAKLPRAGKVVFGVTATICRLDDDTTYCYQIVGEEEADLASGRISFRTPIARALLGREVGDTIDVDAPAGVVSYELLAIDYGDDERA